MKSIPALVALALFAATAFAALPPNHPAPAGASNPANPSMNMKAPVLLEGKVASVIDVDQYTYIEIMQEKGTTWLATTKTPVKKGDTIRYDEGVQMTNFYSKTLKRTFPSVKFVGKVIIANEKK
jgi:hypothetical protein